MGGRVEKWEQDERQVLPLTRRTWRLFAHLIDTVIVLGVSIPAFVLLDLWSATPSGWEEELAHNALIFFIGAFTFIVANYWLLDARGQTIGKWCVDIAIVGVGDGNLGANHILLRRYMPVWLVTLIPVIGPYLALADILPIFGKDRRCVHDYLAGTKVVDVDS